VAYFRKILRKILKK
jgi:broad-specificity NMP kinase